MTSICFRAIIIFFSLACLILSCFAIAGSYKNANYLTSTYLINFHLDGLDLRQIISTSIGSGSRKIKRADTTATATATVSTGTTFSTSSNTGLATTVASQVEAWANAASGLTSSSTTDASDIISAIADVLDNLSALELGLADVYSTSFWGYCRGEKTGNSTTATTSSSSSSSSTSSSSNSSVLKWMDNNFDNSDVNYTWCSAPKVGFFFDPVEILKEELNRTIDGKSVDSQSDDISQLSQTYKSELKQLIDNLSLLDLNLPGNLQNDLKTLNNLTKAGFALMIITSVLSFISIVVQLMGCCVSPDNCCLSFLNFMLQVLVFLAAIIGAGLVTGCYVFVRKQINNNLSEFGIKSFLSINFYAFAFSAAVAALLVVIFSLLGHCCGICGGRRVGRGRGRYRAARQDAPAAYEHYHEVEK
ncbi:hypothetical protein LELG_02943 [Lodderomyces elongisporus NRRL YB-4239]|uniref:Uncharacterized protein n=1 Tax=Lodderomyces elongisporus (strain ATCC 11503 / CBS 2605 / JCM 1781 / NBRC 1676 / NRRL YB-4239) TaxID=379508 RepID=A5E006_LODEL|nr:hypothetical protein LELG_02943 [Lodderomyces elongisporus NRRL YB-4239]